MIWECGICRGKYDARDFYEDPQHLDHATCIDAPWWLLFRMFWLDVTAAEGESGCVDQRDIMWSPQYGNYGIQA